VQQTLDGRVEVPPSAGDLDVGLVDEPAVAGSVPQRAGGVGEQRTEPLYPPVDRDVVNRDATFGSMQQCQLAAKSEADETKKCIKAAAVSDAIL
jgi:hypothetical protein